jgi:hypothetical protein
MTNKQDPRDERSARAGKELAVALQTITTITRERDAAVTTLHLEHAGSTRIAAERDALRTERDKFWNLLCDTVEALGKIAPEAAPYAPGWARKVREERDALRARIKQAVATLEVAAKRPIAKERTSKGTGIGADVEAALATLRGEGGEPVADATPVANPFMWDEPLDAGLRWLPIHRCQPCGGRGKPIVFPIHEPCSVCGKYSAEMYIAEDTTK